MTPAKNNKFAESWHAVYVISRSEKKISDLLNSRGITAYVPLVKTVRQWSDRKKKVEVPLLYGYVFVWLSPKQHESLLETPGVLRFVRSEGKIASIKNIEIERLKQLVELGYHLEAMAIDRHIRKGGKVKISSGSLKGIEGIVLEDKDQRHLLVLLDSIGQCIKVRLPKEILLQV